MKLTKKRIEKDCRSSSIMIKATDFIDLYLDFEKDIIEIIVFDDVVEKSCESVLNIDFTEKAFNNLYLGLTGKEFDFIDGDNSLYVVAKHVKNQKLQFIQINWNKCK